MVALCHMDELHLLTHSSVKGSFEILRPEEEKIQEERKKVSPPPKDEGVSLDQLPLTFEGKVTLGVPALGHLGEEKGVGRAHPGPF